MKKRGMYGFLGGAIAGGLFLAVGLATGASGEFPPFSGEEIESRTDGELTQGTAGTTARHYFVKPVGDLNGDGFGDYVARMEGAMTGVRAVTYVILGGEEPFPEDFDEDYLKKRAAYALQGPSAAPFERPPIPKPDISAPRSLRIVSPVSQQSLSTASPDPSSPVGQPVHYRAIPLKPGSESYAYGINAHGQVVGEHWGHAFLYDGWNMHDLGTLGGDRSFAYDINAPGSIVGYSLTGETDEMGFVNEAFISDGFTMRDLGIRWSSASKINNGEQVVGSMKVDSGAFHGFLYNGGQTIDLGTLDGADSFAHSVNEAGQVVGEADTFIPGTSLYSSRAFLYADGSMRDFGSLGYYCWTIEGEESCYERSVATDINNKGQVAGFSTTSDGGLQHAFLATDGEMADLGTLGGWQSWANAVNDTGQVVGTSLTPNDASYSAFLYDRGLMHDLKDLVTEGQDNFRMWSAEDINNFGQIVGGSYLLDPLYESIAPGKEFTFKHRLGREINFEYWVAAGDSERCIDLWAFLLVELKIETVIANRMGWPGTGSYFSLWLPADKLVRGCGDSVDWRKATVAVPPSLQDQVGNIKVRVRKFGTLVNPTVYLRHFTMN